MAGPVKTYPNTVLRRATPLTSGTRRFIGFLLCAGVRDITLLPVQPVAALWDTSRRALGVRSCHGGGLPKWPRDCRLRRVYQCGWPETL